MKITDCLKCLGDVPFNESIAEFESSEFQSYHVESGALDVFYLNEVKKYFFVSKTNTFLIKYLTFIVFSTFVCKTIGI